MTSPKPLQRMFEAVPSSYDRINRLITLGMDRSWRLKAVKECLAAGPSRILDLCCGTADLAQLISRASREPVTVAGLDFSVPMLELAAKKLSHDRSAVPVGLVQGDAGRLLFKDDSLDCVGIAFGFRNMTYKNPLAEAHLREVHRALADGGRYVIVESSQPRRKMLNRLLKLYCRTAVFWIGSALSGNRGAYRYLSESVADFFAPEEVAAMLRRAGFRKVDYRPLFFGAAGIHTAHK